MGEEIQPKRSLPALYAHLQSGEPKTVADDLEAAEAIERLLARNVQLQDDNARLRSERCALERQAHCTHESAEPRPFSAEGETIYVCPDCEYTWGESTEGVIYG